MPPEMLKQLPGYGADIAKNRAEARADGEAGYGPDKRLKVKLASRELPSYRDPGVILLDQLKEVYVDAELEPVETADYFPGFGARTIPSASTCRPAALIPIQSSTYSTAADRA